MNCNEIFDGLSQEALCDMLDREIAKRQFAEMIAIFYAMASLIFLGCLLFL